MTRSLTSTILLLLSFNSLAVEIIKYLPEFNFDNTPEKTDHIELTNLSPQEDLADKAESYKSILRGKFELEYGILNSQKALITFLENYNKSNPENFFGYRDCDFQTLSEIYNRLIFEVCQQIDGDFHCIDKIPLLAEQICINKIKIKESISNLNENISYIYMMNAAISQVCYLISCCYIDASQSLKSIIEDHEDIKQNQKKIDYHATTLRLTLIRYLFEKASLTIDKEEQDLYLREIIDLAYIFKVSTDDLLPMIIYSLKKINLKEFKTSSFYMNLFKQSQEDDPGAKTYLATLIVSSVIFIEEEEIESESEFE
jgi:hypothetical protein